MLASEHFFPDRYSSLSELHITVHGREKDQIKGIFKPFELGDENRLIRSDVKK